MKKAILFLTFALTFAALSAENVNLSWDANSEPNVTHYNVYRATVSGGQTGTIPIGSTSQGIDPISFTDIRVNLSNPVYYVLTAVNSSNLESGFSDELEVTAAPGVTAPSPPAGIRHTVTTTITTTSTTTVTP